MISRLACMEPAEASALMKAGASHSLGQVSTTDLLGTILALILAFTIGVLGRWRAGNAWLGAPPPPRNELTRLDAVVLIALTGLAIVRYCDPILATYAAFGPEGPDTVQYASSFWNASQGHGFLNPEGVDHLGTHASPIVYLLLPLYQLWPAPTTLPLLSALALCSSVIPTYLLCRLRVTVPAAFACSLLWVAQPLLGVLTVEFHAVEFAVPALLWAFYFLETRRAIHFVAALLITLLCKENASLVVAAFGLMLLLDASTRRVGVFVGGLGIAWFLLATRVIMPMHFGALHGTMEMYDHLGNGLPGIIASPILRPGVFWPHVFSSDTAVYLLAMLLTFLFLPLLAPRYLLIAAPILAQNILSDEARLREMVFHYDSLALPGLVYAFVIGSGRLLQRTPRATTVILLAAVYLLATANYSRVDDRRPEPRPDLHAQVAELMRHVPDGASLMAPWAVGTRYPERLVYVRFPGFPELAEDMVCFPEFILVAEPDSHRGAEPPSPELEAILLEHHRLVAANQFGRLYRDPRPPQQRLRPRPGNP